MADQATHITGTQKVDQAGEAHSCELCGRFDAREFGDRWLCPDCYAGCGSCCAGEFVELDDAPRKQDA